MTGISVPSASAPPTYTATEGLRAVAAEASKGLQLLWRRRTVLITTVITLGLIYLMIQFYVGAGHLNHGLLGATLPALFAYTLAATAALQGAGGISEEVNSGTLEQTHLSPAAPSLLVLGRLGALTVEGLVPAAILTALFWAGFGIHYTVRPDVFVPLLLTTLDAMAYGLLLVALTMAATGIGAITHVFNMMIMFFGGMFVPVIAFPHGVVIFARFIPTTLGVQVLNTTLSGRGLSASWTNGTLPWLLVHVVVLSGLAVAAYVYVIRRAQQEGGLGQR